MLVLQQKRKVRAVSRPAAGRFRPHLESLEDRCVLSTASTTSYLPTYLVSDQAGVAVLQDPNLVNAWGIGLSPTGGAFWVSSNGGNVSTLYTGDVTPPGGTTPSPIKIAPLVVSIPGGAPTGQVFNSTSDFQITTGSGTSKALFIFVAESGDVTAWNGSAGTNAVLATHVDDAVFKGVTIGSVGTDNFLYAADFHHGQIDVFDKTFQMVSSFTDPTVPTGFAPFNVANINGKLYVTFAKQDADAEDDVAGKGNGFIDVFDTSGHLLQRLVSNGPLNSPWGMALAPSTFGQFSNDLLVGNFGDGRINAFDPTSGQFLGQLSSSPGHPLVIDGLWALVFGNGKTAGDTNTLYFSAGPDDEAHGLFGKITANPPGTNPVKATLAADGTLTITGSPGDDRVRVLLDHSGQHVTVVAGGQKIGQFDLAALSSIQFNGFAGDDFFSIDRRITVNALEQGGAGNDVLIGGGGRNVLIGGDGRDVLIAGTGGDLLIAGTTAHDTDPVALNQILLEWGSADSYNTRVAKLQAGDGVPKLDATTVFDDGVRDVLVGGPGLDWFFATLPDKIHHHVPAEQVN